jgi:hypothetical protein
MPTPKVYERMLEEKRERERESGWLIENARQEWWDGKRGGVAANFIKDASHAMRFAREHDAEIARCYLLEPITHLLRCTEHMWPTVAVETKSV